VIDFLVAQVRERDKDSFTDFEDADDTSEATLDC
jgi:hypothetical protein|tara:strand:- start:2703 stop:2804 length:102 start_codon:yes stop_codon:yes gene_type:complete